MALGAARRPRYYCPSLTRIRFLMNWQKIAVTLLFLTMTVGGVGGLMLVGYTVVLHAR